MDYPLDFKNEFYELEESLKYRNKYCIDSARAQWWDYKNDGYYFITICTDYHAMIFGDIKNEVMEFSSLGNLVAKEYVKSFNIRKELIHHITAIMPNHIHSIIQIKNSNTCRDARRASCIENELNNNSIIKYFENGVLMENYGMDVGDACHASLLGGVDRVGGDCGANNNGNKKNGVAYRSPRSISSFVAGFKSSVTKLAKRRRSIWQSRFHDHIIRNCDEYYRIYKYIKNNIKMWSADRFNK